MEDTEVDDNIVILTSFWKKKSVIVSQLFLQPIIFKFVADQDFAPAQESAASRSATDPKT